MIIFMTFRYKEKLYIFMGASSGGQEGRSSPWIFIHGTDIANVDLIVLFFGLFFQKSQLSRFHVPFLSKP